MTADDIVLNKAAIIRRCLDRVNQEFAGSPERLLNFTHQDAIVLNLLRACEASIDLAMHLVAVRRLGVPQTSRDAFRLLREAEAIPADVADALMKMVGFRNIAVHSYQEVRSEILRAIVERHLDDFEGFLAALDL